MTGITLGLTVMILVMMWSTMLVPLLVALFFFSTTSLRRKPVFIFNVFSLLLGLAAGFVCVWYMYHAVLGQRTEDMAFTICVATCFAMASLPVLVESTLLCRILMIYTHPSARMLVLIPLVSLKIARVINICILLKAVAANTIYGASVVMQLWRLRNAKVEWILRLVDNTASAYLLLRNIDFRLALGPQRSGSSSSRLETLLCIATSNFVFPIPLDIALVINGFRRVPYSNGIYIIVCSVYVQIIGVLLATIWAAGVQWSEDIHVPGLSLPTIHFSPNPECATTTSKLSSASELVPDADKSHIIDPHLTSTVIANS